jgi:hypothetical protein
MLKNYKIVDIKLKQKLEIIKIYEILTKIDKK